MSKKPHCEDLADGTPGCRTTFEAYGDDPPCGSDENYKDVSKCEWFDPPLEPENMPVFDVLQNVSNQHVLAPGVVEKTLMLKPVALKLEAVFKMMEIKRINPLDQEWCYELIQSAFRELVK